MHRREDTLRREGREAVNGQRSTVNGNCLGQDGPGAARRRPVGAARRRSTNPRAAGVAGAGAPGQGEEEPLPGPPRVGGGGRRPLGRGADRARRLERRRAAPAHVAGGGVAPHPWPRPAAPLGAPGHLAPRHPPPVRRDVAQPRPRGLHPAAGVARLLRARPRLPAFGRFPPAPLFPPGRGRRGLDRSRRARVRSTPPPGPSRRGRRPLDRSGNPGAAVRRVRLDQRARGGDRPPGRRVERVRPASRGRMDRSPVLHAAPPPRARGDAGLRPRGGYRSRRRSAGGWGGEGKEAEPEVAMRFPSIETAAREARATLVRFPLSILSGLTGMVVVIGMTGAHTEPWQPRLPAAAVLGLALFPAPVTTAERRGVATGARWLVDGAILLGLALLYRASNQWTDQTSFLRFAQLQLIAHLLVAVGPYSIGRREVDRRLEGFWQYNRFLFLRYLVAAFYAAVLWIGLSVALGALDKLFGMKVPGETYFKLLAIMAFGFHPWFFLAGVPRSFAALDTLDDYPAGLKVFTQFVLMPLVAVYLVILTAYLGKIIITRTWPGGWIGYLVSSVSTVGVLALLLVHPIRERADSRWVNWYGRWWFVAILPSLAMLLMASGKRLEQYGVTEPRYFLLVLALWMLGLSLYYGITASRNIKLIPMSLAVVAVLASAGPWGVYAISRRSQVSRLDRILQANHMGRAGDAGRMWLAW